MTIILTHNKQRAPVRSFSRIKALTTYIDDREKCTAMASFGFDDAPEREDQIADMANAAELLDRGGSLKLIQHWSISWKPESGDRPPTHNEMIKAAHEALICMGYGECMAIMAVHENTQHPHVHIVFSRINADQDRIVKEPHGYGRAQKATAIIAKAHGWKTEPRTQYEVTDNGTLKRRFIPPRPKNPTPATPAPSTLKDRLITFYQENHTRFAGWKWGHVHRALAERGIQMECKKGQGLVFSDGQTWESAASICPNMTQTALTRALDGSPRYRQARPEIATILAQTRAIQPTQNTKNKSQDTTSQNTNYNLQNTISAPAAPAAPTPARPPRHRPSETTQKAPSAPSAPLLPPDKAKALYKHHRTASARIKAGCTRQEIATHVALRLRACGHTVYEAMQIMANDPDMRNALAAAYTPAGTKKLQKLTPLAATLRAQERQALLMATWPGHIQTLENEKWQSMMNSPTPQQT